MMEVRESAQIIYSILVRTTDRKNMMIHVGSITSPICSFDMVVMLLMIFDSPFFPSCNTFTRLVCNGMKRIKSILCRNFRHVFNNFPLIKNYADIARFTYVCAFWGRIRIHNWYMKDTILSSRNNYL